jgi:hypothetical protein
MKEEIIYRIVDEMVRLNSNQNILKPFDIEKERAFVIQTQSV